MKAPKCRLCESEHWSYEPHVFASNTFASNTQEHLTDASNGLPEIPRPGLQAAGKVVQGRDAKQRWDRAKYNAYQREYMRKRRG